MKQLPQKQLQLLPTSIQNGLPNDSIMNDSQLEKYQRNCQMFLTNHIHPNQDEIIKLYKEYI